MKITTLVLGVLLAFGSTYGVAEAVPVLTNGNFETGDFSGWTGFTTTNGRVNPVSPPPGDPTFPRVDTFDVNGDGSGSLAALFMVGVEPLSPLVFEGGGIFQDFAVSAADAGIMSIGLDIAVSGAPNSSAGRFDLLVDGALIDQHDFSSQLVVGTDELRSSLLGEVNLAAGNHELRILMARSRQNTGRTPIQYLDNITLVSSVVVDSGGGNNNPVPDPPAPTPPPAIPEPSMLLLMGSGFMGLFVWKQKKTNI